MSGTFLPKERAQTEVDLSKLLMDSSELIPFFDDVYLLPSEMKRFEMKKE